MTPSEAVAPLMFASSVSVMGLAASEAVFEGFAAESEAAGELGDTAADATADVADTVVWFCAQPAAVTSKTAADMKAAAVLN